MEKGWQGRPAVRFGMYVLGLFIMTLGIALSVKSDLGVSPVSSIPYTLTCLIGLEMGRATIVFHVALVLLQIAILGRAFRAKNLLQVPVGVLFGAFTTASNSLFALLPTPEGLIPRLGLMLASTVFIAFGIFLYLPPDLVPLAGEGVMQAISQRWGLPFSRVKIGFDVGMVAISLIACLLVLHGLGSVGVGTVAAAVLVGSELGFFTRHLSGARDRVLHGTAARETAAVS